MFVFHGQITLKHMMSVDFMTNELQSLLWVKGKNKLFEKNNIPVSFISSWDKHSNFHGLHKRER